MGLTRTEAAILDRWDAGHAMRQIARETGLTMARVRKVVETYHCRPGTRAHRARMAHGSTLLRTAILAQFTAAQGAVA